jgi:hypothetical protein
MKYRFLVFTLFTSFFIFKLSSAQTFTEVLGRSTDKSVTISVLFDRQADVYFEWGTNPGTYTANSSTFTSKIDTPVRVVFTNLVSDTKYYYRTRYRSAGSGGSFSAGGEHSFHTQRAKSSSFTFTIESDDHLHDKKGIPALYRICLANQAKDKPDFMLDLGDSFGNDHDPATTSSSDMKFWHYDYLQYFGNICHSVPLYLCIGNHEGENSYYASQNDTSNLTYYATKWRKFYYANPFPDAFYTGDTAHEPNGIGSPETYYSWTWGDALFIVLDVYRYESNKNDKPANWDWSLGETQYKWLKNTLEKSNSKYKFVFAHHTRGQGRGGILTAKYFEWGGYELDGTTYNFDNKRPGWVKPIHQLFKDYGVNIFFQGHDHLFAHETLDNVIYQELPMPADTTYEIGMLANADAYVSDTLDGSGHIRVTVSESCVKVDYVRAYLPGDTVSGIHHNGEVAFSYTIGDCSSAVNEFQVSGFRFQVFPNPAKDKLNIVLPVDMKYYSINLINPKGQTILQTKSKQIDISSVNNGMYFVNIKTEKGELNKKIIINR